jgi:endonuclease YncB( thermonuclease family)
MFRSLCVAMFLVCAGPFNLDAHGPWVTLEGGHFLRKRFNDGDSFHISIKGKEYVFRLYFVDAPETNLEFPKLVDKQATAFGLDPRDTTQVGHNARDFTRTELSGAFVIQTCWQDAAGQGKFQRFYAIITTNNGDLGEQLVSNGLALVRGRQDSPDGRIAAQREWQRLNQLQQKAKREKAGGWGGGRRLNARAKKTTQDSGKKISEAKLDVNTASRAELENVRGIGPSIAGRIIAARPFKSADDLQDVKGIGRGVKYKEIRAYFQ